MYYLADLPATSLPLPPSSSQPWIFQVSYLRQFHDWIISLNHRHQLNWSIFKFRTDTQQSSLENWGRHYPSPQTNKNPPLTDVRKNDVNFYMVCNKKNRMKKQSVRIELFVLEQPPSNQCLQTWSPTLTFLKSHFVTLVRENRNRVYLSTMRRKR